MRTISPVGLLLDVDGPVASTETRTVPEAMLAALLRLAERRVPIGFNTGRSAEFLLRQLIEPLRAAGLPDAAPFYGVCEKAAVWFPFSDVPRGSVPTLTVDAIASAADAPSWLRVDESMAITAEVREAIWTLNRERAGDPEDGGLQFIDRTKLAMVSLEKTVGADQGAFLAVRDDVVEGVRALLAERGLADRITVDPTVISVDVEDRRSGKDLGVLRCRALMAEAGVEQPARWFTAGDSRTDYAMADRLHEDGARVDHVDVRPSDGVPATAYPVLTAADLAAHGHGRPDDVHERVGLSLLEYAETLLDATA